MRGFVISLLVVVFALLVPMNASAADVHYGSTSVIVPNVLLTAHVDNKGNVTGTGSQVKVSHSDPGLFCHKVASVEVGLHSNYCTGLNTACWFGQGKKTMNYCSFKDATFDIPFPAVFPGLEGIAKTGWINDCKASGKNGAQFTTQHPFFIRTTDFARSNLFTRLYYNNGKVEYLHYQVPPVILTCDACPKIVVKDSMQLQADAMANVLATSIVTGGGIPPYSVGFSKLPTGLFQQGNLLTGRPAAGTYEVSATVHDACMSANNAIQTTFRFFVVR